MAGWDHRQNPAAPSPSAGQTELWDDLVPGFGLRIAAGGARTYFVMKRLNSKLVRRTVGKVAAAGERPGPGEWPFRPPGTAHGPY